ncbi:MAG: hypothetical protein Q7U54_10400 [Bacteroidales bacterium]|nr:hypothetical protein [Bacteroidales bacterium]
MPRDKNGQYYLYKWFEEMMNEFMEIGKEETLAKLKSDKAYSFIDDAINELQ